MEKPGFVGETVAPHAMMGELDVEAPGTVTVTAVGPGKTKYVEQTFKLKTDDVDSGSIHST